MISKTHLSTILLLAAIIWGLLLAVSGVTISISWLRYLSTVTGILLLLLVVFDLWLWRLPIFQGWFVKRPVIHGTWKVILHSNWVEPSNGENIEPIEGFMVIRQKYSALSLRLLTEESSSEIIGAEINSLSDGRQMISGVYGNEPRQLLRQKSPIHYGAILLEISGKPVTNIKGQYWTDRNTSGEIELTSRVNRIYYDYETAVNAINSGSASKTKLQTTG